MKIKQVVGLIVLSFLFALGLGYAYGAEQEYIVIDLSKCEMEPCPMDKSKKWLEKAWVVHPNVIITTPKDYAQLDMIYDGEFNGIPARYLLSSYQDSLKSYIVYVPQKVSNDIPAEVLEAYGTLVLMGLDSLMKSRPRPDRTPEARKVPVNFIY